MPCVITDGRFDDKDLHAHMESDEYNMPDEDEDVESELEDRRENDAEDRRLFG